MSDRSKTQELLQAAQIACALSLQVDEAASLFGRSFLRIFCDLADAIHDGDKEEAARLLATLEEQEALLVVEYEEPDDLDETEEVEPDAAAWTWGIKEGLA